MITVSHKQTISLTSSGQKLVLQPKAGLTSCSSNELDCAALFWSNAGSFNGRLCWDYTPQNYIYFHIVERVLVFSFWHADKNQVLDQL